jgi:hypothetical protein
LGIYFGSEMGAISIRPAHLHALRDFSNEWSQPGDAVSISAIIDMALTQFIERHAFELKGIRARAEWEELERVQREMGGGDAA